MRIHAQTSNGLPYSLHIAKDCKPATLDALRRMMELVAAQFAAPVFDHVWYWKSRLPERKGQLCRVVARGKLNSVWVEFEDGFRVVTSRYAVRKKK
jgi:hypothetical protein